MKTSVLSYALIWLLRRVISVKCSSCSTLPWPPQTGNSYISSILAHVAVFQYRLQPSPWGLGQRLSERLLISMTTTLFAHFRLPLCMAAASQFQHHQRYLHQHQPLVKEVYGDDSEKRDYEDGRRSKSIGIPIGLGDSDGSTSWVMSRLCSSSGQVQVEGSRMIWHSSFCVHTLFLCSSFFCFFFLHSFLFLSSNLLSRLVVLFSLILILENPHIFRLFVDVIDDYYSLAVLFSLVVHYYSDTRSWFIFPFSFLFSLLLYLFFGVLWGCPRTSSFGIVRLDSVRCGGVLD